MIGKGHELGKPVTTSQALEILEERKKAGELGYEQQISEAHAQKYATLKSEKASEMVEELLATGISAKTAVKVVDIMPANEAQLKTVLILEGRPVEEDTTKKILEIVNKFRGK
ncbi:MAG: DNA-directed RNA polymerase subunit F [Candidatus Micrarchaeota archaeon]|nr:DNA-directed RNA polymerase subunit F [Candidatus Micrarchaeota archaeon]